MPQTKYSPLRSGLLVISLLALILTSIFLSRRNTQKIQEESVSIYKDRLVPTAILVNLMSTIYKKRMLLETTLLASKTDNISQLEPSLNQFDRRTDSLLTEFERTKLTVKEVEWLKLFNRKFVVYNQLEGELTTNFHRLPKEKQVQLAASASAAFAEIIKTLNELSSLQLTVGQELLEESRRQTNDVFVLTALQIGLVLFVGLSLFWHRF
ncbi:MCP four helix bundle domain-containing protein [Spirosoma aerophilum]